MFETIQTAWMCPSYDFVYIKVKSLNIYWKKSHKMLIYLNDLVH